jgi:hypothetical protein
MPTKKQATNNESESQIKRYVESGNPSEIVSAAWIIATYTGKAKKATERRGKWLMFVGEKYVDDTWKNIK